MNYSFTDIVDISVLQSFLESQWQTSGIMLTLVDPDENVLAAAGWQEICTRFHRSHPETLALCRESDGSVKSHLSRLQVEGSSYEYTCKNGLVSIAVPIFIEGRHRATLFTGQFLYESPDEAFFKEQAQRYGFDEKAYFEALAKVPVCSRHEVQIVLNFLIGLVKLLTRMGEEKLWQLEGLHALEKSEEKFRSLFENYNDGVCIIDMEGRFVELNRVACEQLGYTRQELLQMSLPQLLAPDRVGNFKNRVREIQVKKSLVFETKLQRKVGSFLPVESSVRLFEYSGQPVFLCTVRDISERLKAEKVVKTLLAEAEEARSKIEAILNSVADGLIVTDLGGRVVLMNRKAETLAGITMGEAFSLPLEKVFTEKVFGDQVEAVLADRKDVEPVEWTVTGSNDRIFEVQARTSIVWSSAGRKAGIISLLRDVTRERELDRMKNEFISTAAHELRTPLTSVMGFSEVLLHHEQYGLNDPVWQKQMLATIYEKSQRLHSIVEDLLDLGRIQAGQLLSLHKAPCDICELLRQVISEFEKTACSHRLEFSPLQESVELLVDRSRMEQVLENLISNAIKFSAPKSLVQVRCQVVGDVVQISVEDDGIGMNPDQVGRVFDKFYRADASGTATEGLGLGMSISKSIVEAHGGEIQVESEPNKGTRAFFTIPMGS